MTLKKATFKVSKTLKKFPIFKKEMGEWFCLILIKFTGLF